MNSIIISNDTFYDKDYNKTFSYQEKYNFFGINTGSSTLVPFYLERLKEVIGDKADEVLIDRELSRSQIEQIKIVFEREMDRLISTRIPTGKPPHKGITYKGVLFELDLRLTSPIDRRMEDVFTILEISKECLDQNKPMYLSIE